MRRYRVGIECHAERIALLTDRNPAVGRTQRQVTHAQGGGIAQGLAGAQSEPPYPEGGQIVLPAQLKTAHSRCRQSQHEVFDQAHFLGAGNQTLATGQCCVGNAGTEQAGLPVDAMSLGEVEHDLTDGHRMKLVV